MIGLLSGRSDLWTSVEGLVEPSWNRIFNIYINNQIIRGKVIVLIKQLKERSTTPYSVDRLIQKGMELLHVFIKHNI